MRCPFCAEKIKNAAVICRYCGRSVVAGVEGENSSATTVSIDEKNFLQPEFVKPQKQFNITVALSSLLIISAVAIGVFLFNTWNQNRKIEQVALNELEVSRTICQEVQKIIGRDTWGDDFDQIRQNMINQASDLANYTPRNFEGWALYKIPKNGELSNSFLNSFLTQEVVMVAGAMWEMQEKFRDYALYRILIQTSPNLEDLEAKASRIRFQDACATVANSLRIKEFQLNG